MKEVVISLDKITSVKAVHGGYVIAAKPSHQLYGDDVEKFFLTTVAFDVLYSFLEIRYKVAKGDFGQYGELDHKRIMETNALIVGNFVFRISEVYDDPDDNGLIKLRYFFTVVGTHTPEYRFGWSQTGQDVDLVGFNRWMRRPQPDDVFDPELTFPTRNERQYHDRFREATGFNCHSCEANYGVLLPRRQSDLALACEVPKYSPEREPGGVQYIPLTIPDYTASAAADLLKGITAIPTFPENGYKLTVTNGLGSIDLGMFSKEELASLANTIVGQ